MKLIKLLMLYVRCRDVDGVMKTIIYTALMMGVMIFVCILCTLMEMIS